MKKSHISNLNIGRGEEVKGADIRDEIFQLIQEKNPSFQKDDFVSLEELNHFRRLYMANLIKQEQSELAAVNEDVLDAIKNNSILAENIQNSIEKPPTLGQRVADNVANFGGSWTFIISFFCFIVIWMLANIYSFFFKPFDPFPFILLNLILSCLASIQAPIIMMSQNRTEEKDRTRNENDFKINMKAELEIKLLNEKIDHLIIHQNNKLIQIQEIQTDYLNDLMKVLQSKLNNDK